MASANSLRIYAIIYDKEWLDKGIFNEILHSELPPLSNHEFNRLSEKMAIFSPLEAYSWLKNQPMANINLVEALRLQLNLTNELHAGAKDKLLHIQKAIDENDENALKKLWESFYISHGLSIPSLIENCRINLHKSTEHFQPSGKPVQLSIIMTAYNAAETLEMAVNSLLNQTLSPLEIIIIDDASSDKTFEICEKLAVFSSKIKIHRLNENIGTYAAKNIALAKVKGDYIMCHDADDWSHPERLALQLKELQGNKKLKACLSRFFRIDEVTSKPISKRIYPFYRLNPSSLLFHKEIIENVGVYDASTRHSGDNEFIDRIKIFYGKDVISTVGKPLSIGLARSNSLTHEPTTGINTQGRSSLRENYINEYKTNHHSLFIDQLRNIAPIKDSLITRINHYFTKAKPVEAFFIGFKPWKNLIPNWFPQLSHEIVNRHLSEEEFLNSYGKKILSQDNPKLFVWGYKYPPYLDKFVSDYGIKRVFVEDGFIRSRGINDKAPPLSLVVDSRANYFDSRKPSDLELLLNSYELAMKETSEAEMYFSRFKALNLSKYNLQKSDYDNKNLNHKILVIGQVENDASLLLGSDITDVKQAIKKAYSENPAAHIFYKPHPRNIGENITNILDLFPKLSIIAADVALNSIYSDFDKIYTLTSLAGFEALLRGCKVITLGAPFYSGWGLTEDRVKLERRIKKRTLLELFAITYMIYPLYFNEKPYLKTDFKTFLK